MGRGREVGYAGHCEVGRVLAVVGRLVWICFAGKTSPEGDVIG